ncbi:MAG: PD-(D/E)XK nuclease family protein [Desulfomonilaceae bacterium]
MNKFLRSLASFCDKHKLDPKILIGPSLRVIRQWVETLTRNGISVINLRGQTFKGFVFTLASPILNVNGQRSISEIGNRIIVSRLLDRLIASEDSYFSAISGLDTLSKSLSKTIGALRISGIKPDDILLSAFESPEKANDIVWLLTEYLSCLKTGKLVDYAEVLTMVTQKNLLDGPQLPPEYFVLAPEDVDLAPLERHLADSLGENRFMLLPVDCPASGTEVKDQPDTRPLRWILDPSNAPIAKSDGSVTIFHAVGHSNEVREALRRVLFPEQTSSSNPKYHLDEVELLYTDQRVYIPIIFDLFSHASMSLERNTPFDLVTFADGIPTRLSRPGRGLIAWLSWIRDGYPQLTLTKMIQDGLLLSESLTDEISFSRVAALLRAIPIGQGPDNYQIRIARKIEDLEQETKNQQELASKGSGETGGNVDSGEWLPIFLYRELFELVNGMLEISRPTDKLTMLRSALAFLENFVRSSNEFDNYAKLALKSGIQEMLEWIVPEDSAGGLNIHDWLSSLANETRVMGSGPQPGKIHVASVLSGGHSGRKHTIILGLDDTLFPGLTVQDPAFLDHEKKVVSSELVLASSAPKQNVIKLASLFARLEGAITLGFTSYDPLGDRELFPSSVLFSAFRILSNQHDADQETMFKSLGAPVATAPPLPEGATDDIEWWLSTLCSHDYNNAPDVVLQNFPNLETGMAAYKKRCSDIFTEYDGNIEQFKNDTDPTGSRSKVLSASALETLGTCPLRYFFRHVLGLKTPDEPTFDPSRWLDHSQLGKLAHEVFHAFVLELMTAQRKPKFETDLPQLLETLSIFLERYGSLVPPPSDSAFRRQVIELESAMRVFLVEEERTHKTWEPFALEACIGLAESSTNPSSHPEPISISLPDGRSFQVKGAIDRIDRCETGTKTLYRIIDYKMGSPNRYQKDKNFTRGSIVQPMIYTMMAKSYLGREKIFSSVIDDFVYFFPSVKNRGLRIHIPVQKDSDMGVMANLCQLMTNAAFMATDDVSDCGFCDYLLMCGETKTLTESSHTKLQNLKNTTLEPLRDLRKK